MRAFTTLHLPWLVFLVAAALWAGVGYFAWTIYSAELLQAERAIVFQEDSLRHSAALRILTLARDTKEEREQLEEVARVDVIRMLEVIEGVGRDAGISLEIGQAISDSTMDADARFFAFVIEGAGSFARVVHAAALLESLPIPSTVDQIQFEMLPAGASTRSSGTWHLVARMRFMSAADIAS